MNIRTNLLAASLATILAFAGAVSAKPSGEDRHARIVEALELDDTRAEEVRQIMQSFGEKNRALHQEVRKEMKALRAEKHEQLQSVLTDEEMAKLKAMRADMRKHHKNEFHKGQHGQHAEHEHHQ